MSCCRLLLPVAVAFCFANKSKNIATGELAIKLQFFIRDDKDLSEAFYVAFKCQY